ncbi:MAG: GNAT family N-acetyltransferase [Actinomycetota bacterium]|nr:GNAT family N-acetyltransferase [Rubrobacter sp.]MDQ3507905.1 GNAT family N-acetyltransferase [Actinomycetota bacterium]
MTAEVVEVREWTGVYEELLSLADRLGQARYIPAREDHIEESVLLGAFVEGRCVGFLRFMVQIIGSDEGRPPIFDAGRPLTEGFVEAFGVDAEYRRRGVGKSMQEWAIEFCEGRGCYQMRSRSPVSSRENYALKISMGYAIHPSGENDSYYFVRTLKRV